MRPSPAIGLLVAAGLVAAGCGDAGPSAAPGALAGEATILAASSLTAAFGDLEQAFEADHPDVDLQISFDGSATLATAIISGAPADLFASADEPNLQKVADQHLTTGAPVSFATNALQIVVAEGNPLGIETLEDLTEPGVTLSLCGPEVPCGTYAGQAFEKAGLETPAAGEQEDVKGVLSQVQLGEADAGIVYRTDVQAATGVEGIDLPTATQVSGTYLASVLTDAEHPEVARALLAFLTSAAAREILVEHGFGLP